ncbi:uncharacterized protein LOC118732373 [Rhagoletis pomonella]|uniref:uncharacterized protein LOC118732373 n=1 Tax=Rhagoletis pomonella TaxID=28610 RepID=UPI001782BDE5|nr:uncharacterized protein LOC118732373 [Rhagoletis pomonella]
MQTIVNDISTYKVLKRDPTNRLQDKNNELVEKLFSNKIIDVKEKNALLCKTANPPRIYGLPKIHKEENPLTPICSSVNSPSYNLCKYVVKILKKVTMSSVYNVQDAIEFKNKIKDTYVYDDESLVSFDVVSLFPSILVDLALEIIASKWEDMKEYTYMSKELFLTVVKFCIKENRYFKYNNKIYEQRSGMPMGSPSSPVIADIIMEELLKKFEQESVNKPRLLTKYVDDLFAIVKTEDTNDMLTILNGLSKSIKFTIEVEKEGKLPFLDTLVIRRNNEITIDWYKKPTASGRLVNFNSKQERRIIVNIANNFVRRVLSISDRIYHNKNIFNIKKTLEDNDFPGKLIKNLIQNYYVRPNEEKKNDDSNKKIYKTATYVCPRVIRENQMFQSI